MLHRRIAGYIVEGRHSPDAWYTMMGVGCRNGLESLYFGPDPTFFRTQSEAIKYIDNTHKRRNDMPKLDMRIVALRYAK